MLPAKETPMPQDNIHYLKSFALASLFAVFASICKTYTIEIQAVSARLDYGKTIRN
jgi:hypothetical protein